MPTEFKVVAVIPARWSSSRFPGKPLANLHGKPMIQWVVDKTRKAQLVSEVLVATDDQRIFDAVSGFGGRVIMTSQKHSSGTDRIAEAVAKISCDIVVNVQGDEPLMPPSNIDLVVDMMQKNSEVQVSTLMAPIQNVEEIFDPNVTKVVASHNGFALYFSRSPIPFHRERRRDTNPKSETDSFESGNVMAFKHIGLYAYTKPFLMRFSKLPKSPLEDIEKLEQLRILENGIPIKIAKTDEDSIGVDCPKDLKKVQQLMNEPVSG